MPVETTAKPWKPQWKQTAGNHGFLITSGPVRALVVANLLLVRTRMRTNRAYRAAYFLCAICAITAHSSGGEPWLRPTGYMPAGRNVAQRVNMPRKGCVSSGWRRASRIDRMRDGCARRTARNTPAGTGRQPSVGCFGKGIACATDQGKRPPMEVTTQGIRRVSTPNRGYTTGYRAMQRPRLLAHVAWDLSIKRR